MTKWIWTAEPPAINVRACFGCLFPFAAGDVQLRISAVTRYRVWVNGIFLGRGPIRAAKGVRIFDQYDVTPYLHRGENLLAVEVWHHGVSTYQFAAEPAGLRFEITSSGEVLASSGEKVHAVRNQAVLSHMPKRNVNLGYSDYLDGRAFPWDWYRDWEKIRAWPAAVCLPAETVSAWSVLDRPIRPMHHQAVRPQRIVAVEDVRQRCQVYSINLRPTLFPERADANETTLGVWLGTVLSAPKAMEGTLSFPNRLWNGLLGDLYLGGKHYPITSDTRADVPVHVAAGRQLMLIRVAGTVDDLYCHLELSFPEPIQCVYLPDFPFFVLRPEAVLPVCVDGSIMDAPKEVLLARQLENDPLWQMPAQCQTVEALRQKAGARFLCVPASSVVQDAYLLSAARRAEVLARYAVHEENQGILWDNDCETVIHLPEAGDCRRMLLDFGTIHVGEVSATLEAGAGTVLDLYGFENDDHHDMDFTSGLNNGIRYICREGWQKFEGMARLGFRFLLVTVHQASRPVRIRELVHVHTTYAVTNAGEFSCSDMMLTRIFDMCRETNLLCTEDSFTDCPTYEQAFWIGDAYISALVNTCLYGDVHYQLHNAKLAATALANTPLMNALTPTDWDTSIPMWMMNWIFSIFSMVSYDGNSAVISHFYPDLIKVLRAYAAYVTPEEGLYLRSWNLLDWAPLDISDTGTVAAQEGMLACCMKMVGRYALERGHHEDGEFLLSMHDLLKKHLNLVMWDGGRHAYRDGWTRDRGFSSTVSVQTHLILYLMEMVPEDRKKTVEGYLLQPPDDFVQVGSPFILFYLYEALIRFGQKDFVFADIRRRWGEMLKFDATTCWEVFPGFYENSRTRSYCHSWSSSPAYFIMKYLTGLRETEDGWQAVSLEAFPADLSWCRATYPTSKGRIHLEWKRNGSKVTVLLEIPEGIRYQGGAHPDWQVTVRTLKQGKGV